VIGFIKDGKRVVGVRLRNRHTNSESEAYATITVNAGGIWGYRISEMAGATVNMFPAKGALLIFGHRVNNVVLNRCRKPADADILVPGDTISLIGTTSSRVPYDQIDDMQVTPEEVDLLLREGAKLAPSLAYTRILRAYSGVRPLVAADNDASGRNISRGIVCLDHEVRDDVPGFITITGGKLMTYRLMAEWATDLVCKKLNIDKRCQTAELCLPGSDAQKEQKVIKGYISPSNIGSRAAEGRHGSMSRKIASESRYDRSLVCEGEAVSIGEVNYAIDELRVQNLINLRRRTRVGMGTCQGELCACRAAGLLGKANGCATKAQEDLADFLNERWRGMYPVAWGDTLCETQFTSWVYEGVCGLDTLTQK
jgi:glycerol-3-phosphate dehydrogenase